MAISEGKISSIIFLCNKGVAIKSHQTSQHLTCSSDRHGATVAYLAQWLTDLLETLQLWWSVQQTPHLDKSFPQCHQAVVDCPSAQTIEETSHLADGLSAMFHNVDPCCPSR